MILCCCGIECCVAKTPGCFYREDTDLLMYHSELTVEKYYYNPNSMSVWKYFQVAGSNINAVNKYCSDIQRS